MLAWKTALVFSSRDCAPGLYLIGFSAKTFGNSQLQISRIGLGYYKLPVLAIMYTSEVLLHLIPSPT